MWIRDVSRKKEAGNGDSAVGNTVYVDEVVASLLGRASRWRWWWMIEEIVGYVWIMVKWAFAFLVFAFVGGLLLMVVKAVWMGAFP